MRDPRVGVTNYPLYWPPGKVRAPRRLRSRFGESNIYRETQGVLTELERLGAKKSVVSTNMQLRQDGLPYANQREPGDPGVAVWFWLPNRGVSNRTAWKEAAWTQYCLACDRWDLVEHNARAIAKHIEALRGQDRWGVASVQDTFAGFKVLPERVAEDPFEVLGVRREQATPGRIRDRYLELAKAAHPDQGGDHEQMIRLTRARDEALSALNPA